jgi:hypothetical protein
LSKGMRIPCYKGMEPVRLTYDHLLRQIRGVLRVAKLQIASAGGNGRSAQPIKYRYFATGPIALCFEGF